MTQEQNTAASVEKTPEAAEGSSNKRNTARKAPAKKPTQKALKPTASSPKKVTAKKAAPAKSDTSGTEKTEVPAKKPVRTRTTKKAPPSLTPTDETAAGDTPPAEPMATGKVDAVTPAKTRSTKPSSQKKAPVKPKRASSKSKVTANAMEEAAESAELVVPEKIAAKTSRSKETAQARNKKATPDQEEGAPIVSEVSGSESVPEEDGEKQPSRRSRRGGRRRNKKPTQSGTVENGLVEVETSETDVQETVGPEKNERQKKTASKPDSKATASKRAPETREEVKVSPGKRKMFISVLSGELVEVVLAEEGQVQEYYVEMQHQAKVKGNIYKGVVSNVDANLQAAFISYADGVKNGFLQIDEVHPEYYVSNQDPAKNRKYPPIQKVLKTGQEILVQVVKEPAGTKGAFLTSYLSLPGRFLVLTPGRDQIGVSRKVDDDVERSRLKTILDTLSVGPGLGVIVRTVSTGASKTSLQRDLQFLKRLWKEVRAKGQTAPTPSLIYEELDLSTRAVRDYLTDDVQEVWVDDAQTAQQVRELATLLFPKKKDLVQEYRETGSSLFERFSLQKQLDQIRSREVSLPSGGRLAIDHTEALTAIDINSGRSSGKSNFEDMAYRTNLEAAKAIPAQLRLRDIGGQVVVDFIEMRDKGHWREVEKAVRNGMKGDRARYDVGKIGPFGMLEIVRQRLGSSAISVSSEPCPCCKGTGIRRNMEWQAMQSLRDIARMLRQASASNTPTLTYSTEPELAFYLLNAKRAILQRMEEEAGVHLDVRPAAG